MSDEPEARVEIINGQPVLIDPAAEGVIAAVEAQNRKIAVQNLRDLVLETKERLDHFVRRIVERGLTWEDAVVTCIQVDDHFGGMLTEALMPGHDWQAYRDRGETPCARGLAGREGIQAILDEYDKLIPTNAGRWLRETRTYALVAVGYGTILVEPLDPPSPQSTWERLGRPDNIDPIG